jgi:hypothetical protein
VYITAQATAAFLARLVQTLPIGTNLALAQVLFCLIAGYLLSSRGALIPALVYAGLSQEQTLRAAAALRQGSWSIHRLLGRFAQIMRQDRQAQPLQIGVWQPLLLDWVGFFRPRLRGCCSKHFDSQAGKALPALEFGMVAAPLVAGSRTFPALKALTRSGDTRTLLLEAAQHQKANQVIVIDRQAKVGQLFGASIHRFVLRAAVNGVFYRKEVPPQPPGKRGRKPTHGERVRPLVRTYKGKPLPVTAPDRTETFLYLGRQITAERFEGLVVPRCPLALTLLVIRDPKYNKPWLLITDLHQESAENLFLMYRSRWHIEVLPLTAKQLLGGARSFVHSQASRYRLPELCLLAASLSLYLSALAKVVPSGFWDRKPKPTAGRFRRALSGAAMPEFESLEGVSVRVRQKRSVHGHLPKGVMANRRYRGQRATPAVTGK